MFTPALLATVLDFFGGVALVVLAVLLAPSLWRRLSGGKKRVDRLIRQHFRPVPLDELTVLERRFPARMRADLQRAVERLVDADCVVRHFCGLHHGHGYGSVTISECISTTVFEGVTVGPPEYEEVDIGESEPVRCLKNALWLLERAGQRFAALISPGERFGELTSIQFQVATANRPEAIRIAQEFFKRLEEAVQRAECYRGKVLSLEPSQEIYTGRAVGITVHTLPQVRRDEVILPQRTLELLERNIIEFVRRRADLLRFGLPSKKGVLFYGPPGTGKTHTIHYLAGELKGHTMLLIAAEQVGLLPEYIALARLLQPSIVVLEDADLIARERSQLSACGEALLHRLLNEMDGLRCDAQILFILTTNRPEMLEPALAARPGRIDQAIEFPLPDEECRAKLVRLYAADLELTDELVAEIVKRTEQVSPAFIKELMRRSMQFHLERGGPGRLELSDVQDALDELLFRGGSLNLKLLGAQWRSDEVQSHGKRGV